MSRSRCGSRARARHRLAVACTVAIALTPAACGGGGGGSFALDVLAKAVAKSKSAVSARYTASFAIQGTGKGIPTFDFTGSGVITDNGRLYSLDATARDIPVGGGVTLPRLRMFLILGQQTDYMRFVAPATLAALMPPGKPWIRSPANASGPTAELGQNDPAQFLTYLQETSDIKRIGRETVRGVSTTHYRGTLLFTKLKSLAQSKGQNQISPSITALEQYGVKGIPLDAWIDDQGLGRRIEIDWSISNPDNKSQKVRVRIQVDLFDYGANVKLQTPPPQATITFQQFTKLTSGG